MEDLLITQITPEGAKKLHREQLSEILHTMFAYVLDARHNPEINSEFDKADEEYAKLIDECCVLHFYDEETFEIRIKQMNEKKGTSFTSKDFKVLDDGTRFAAPTTYISKFKHKRFKIFSKRYQAYNKVYSKELAPIMLWGLFYEPNHEKDKSLIYVYNNYANIEQIEHRKLQGEATVAMFLDHINKYQANPQNLNIEAFTNLVGSFFDSLMPELPSIRIHIAELQEKLKEEEENEQDV